MALVPVEKRGFFVKYSDSGVVHEFGQFDLSKMDDEQTQAGFANVNSSFRFGTPLMRDGFGFVMSAMAVSYRMGCERKELLFKVALSQAALNGRECTCCLFHGKPSS